MEQFTIALIGECMIELQEVQPGVIQQTFGGDTLNTAIYMARLGAGLPVQVDYVTALGRDRFSDKMVAFWEAENVGSSMVQRVGGELPGLYYIQLDAAGERVFYYWRGQAAAKRCFHYPGSEAVLERLNDYDALYLSGISLAILEEESRERLLCKLNALHGLGKAIHFDCNFRPHLWPSVDFAKEIYHRLFPLLHTVLLNVEEGEILLGRSNVAAMHSVLAAYGARESVVRDGANPCSVACMGRRDMVAAQHVPLVVDTTAAGDSFGAAYLLARRFGRTPQQAVQLAHRLAACVIGHKGAVAPREAMPFTCKALLNSSGEN